MSFFNRIPAPSSAALQVAEALRRQAQAQPQVQQKPSGGQQPGTGALVNRAGADQSAFEPQRLSRKLDLTGEGSQRVAYLQQPEVPPEPEAASFTPLEPRELRADLAMGEVSHQDGTVYNGDPAVVLAGTIPGASYCALTAFTGIADSVEGWASKADIRAVLEQHGTASSVAIWDQISANPALSGTSPGTGLTPLNGQITEVALPDGQPLPVELTVGDSTLSFEAVEVEIRNDAPVTADNTTSTLESLEDMAVGDVRAVMMRPINYDGTSATTEVGHWVMVEKTDEGYRLTQSSPRDWALLGMESGPEKGGVYVHEFAGDTALADVSQYIHAEAQYSSDANMYAVVVLDPVVPDPVAAG